MEKDTCKLMDLAGEESCCRCRTHTYFSFEHEKSVDLSGDYARDSGIQSNKYGEFWGL